MKNKKLIAATVISALTLSAVGCSTGNYKLAKNIDRSVDGFVACINKLDYVETNSKNNNIGKVIQTAADSNEINENTPEIQIENDITKPEDRDDNFKLYYLTDIPYISLTTDDNGAFFSMELKFSTDKIENVSNEINEQINKLIIKRSILMIYVNEIFNGNVNLSNEDKVAINAYVNVIKENTSFLNGNRGMVRNQLGIASNLISSRENENLINYYIIKSGEALQTRSAKIDAATNAIDSIIELIENNLTENSCYYNTSLNDTYNNIISNLINKDSVSINENSSNKEIAETIAESLIFTRNETDIENQTIKNNSDKIETKKNDTETNQETEKNQSIDNINNQNIVKQNQNSNQIDNNIQNNTVNENENSQIINTENNKNNPLFVENKNSLTRNNLTNNNANEENNTTLKNTDKFYKNKINNQKYPHYKNFDENKKFIANENHNVLNEEIKNTSENFNNFVSNPGRKNQRPEVVPFRNI